MKKLRSLLWTAVLASLLLSAVNISSSASSASDFIVKDGVLTAYNGTDINLMIPNNLGITKIGLGAFMVNTTIESVTIPEGVLSIENQAFLNCIKLKSVQLPSSLTSIGDRAFAISPNLEDINIPAGVTSIGDSAFIRTKLSTVIYINNQSELCYVPDTVASFTIPATVSKIGGGAFHGNKNLKSLTIPSSVVSIGAEAFKFCLALTSVAIPDSVTFIGYAAFLYSGITNPIFIQNNSILCYVPQSLTSYSIPSTVTEIGDGAFAYCTKLKSVTIPNGVKSIGNGAFTACQSLKTITIPDSVTSIDQQAFSMCYSLASISIPESVTEIGAMSFYATSIREPIIINNGTVLCHVPAVTHIEVPETVVTINGGAISGKGIFSVTIPEGTTSIESFAFYECRELVSVTIPETVTKIDSAAFILSDNVTIFGKTGSYAHECAKENGMPFIDTSVQQDAKATTSTVLINGTLVKFESYNINGYNYFKLRDLAMALSKTSSIFDASYNGQTNEVIIYPRKNYTPVGGELTTQGSTAVKMASFTTSKILLDDSPVKMAAYSIGGNNYFKLRDLGITLGFNVSWDGTTNTIMILA